MLLYTSTFELVLCKFAISNLCNAISKSRKLGCAISKLRKLGCAISKLVSNFAISNLHSAISKLRKFANCAEHIHSTQFGNLPMTRVNVRKWIATLVPQSKSTKTR